MSEDLKLIKIYEILSCLERLETIVNGLVEAYNSQNLAIRDNSVKDLDNIRHMLAVIMKE